MMLLHFLLVTFLLTGTFAVNSEFQSKECTFTKSKQPSCLYFVMRNDLNHEQASQYCFNQFNGALVAIYNSYDEAIEVMKRYYWWAESDMSTPRLRFGMLHQYDSTFIYTYYNPLDNNEKAVDMNIWKRSFPPRKQITIGNSMYDKTFTYREPHIVEGTPETYEYMAIKPTNMKWSQANFYYKTPFVCEVPRFPKAYCEPGWWLHMKSRSCFYLHTEEKSFQESAMYCRNILKSNLASINDETENDMARKMIQQQSGFENNQVWFGLRHDASKSEVAKNAPTNTQSPEFATYFAEHLGYNVDGTPVSTFTYFAANQPNGFRAHTKENCILFEAENNQLGAGQRWHDYNCDTTKAWALCRKMSSTQPYRN